MSTHNICFYGDLTIIIFQLSSNIPSKTHLISSPEPKAHRWAYRIPMVRCRPSTISNVFSSETTWPIKPKFYVEPPWEGGKKVYINGPGHMSKMVAMPIYGKNLKKSSSLEPEVL